MLYDKLKEIAELEAKNSESQHPYEEGHNYQRRIAKAEAYSLALTKIAEGIRDLNAYKSDTKVRIDCYCLNVLDRIPTNAQLDELLKEGE